MTQQVRERVHDQLVVLELRQTGDGDGAHASGAPQQDRNAPPWAAKDAGSRRSSR